MAYSPMFLYQTPYLTSYFNQPYVSPFIPPANLPPSPLLSPDSRRVHFEGDGHYHRQRRPSWHGGLAPPVQVPFPSPPVLYTPLPPVVGIPTQAAPPFTHHRRRSDTCIATPSWFAVPTMGPTLFAPIGFPSPPAPPPRAQVHPLLDGEGAGGPRIYFDLSHYEWSPLRTASVYDRHGSALTQEELRASATYPPVWHMVITCDEISDWPIVLDPKTVQENRSREASPFLHVPFPQTNIPPISVHDVLYAVWKHLQTRITQQDWARLDQRQVNEISRAYTRRSRTFPTSRDFDKEVGVRRIDYLVDKYCFRGIARPYPTDSFEKMKLVVGPPPSR
ncbi:uncharacterized protein BXZ73DRAFT_43896 [Epithele typhae]|uniref:uncharacterized protein n=1 Tax=Epithele typhae TaxID=378194 RepID=UPI00200850A6|nr:uncharacterized protein BXZ73DRAFT_43896 [Epithele typhae]KAH9939376.1 hypothetical protein BXZ73DRAFT_43896 [Epithele typhae]